MVSLLTILAVAGWSALLCCALGSRRLRDLEVERLERLSGCAALRLDRRGRVRAAGPQAVRRMGLWRRADPAQLADLPLLGLLDWFGRVEQGRGEANGPEASEGTLELQALFRTDRGLLLERGPVRVRVEPDRPRRGLLPGLLLVGGGGATSVEAWPAPRARSRKGYAATSTPALDQDVETVAGLCRHVPNLGDGDPDQGIMGEASDMESRDRDDQRLQDPEFLELVNDFIAALDDGLKVLEEAARSGDLSSIEQQSRALADTAGDYRFGELARIGDELGDLAAAHGARPELETKLEELRQAVHGLSGHVLIEKPRE